MEWLLPPHLPWDQFLRLLRHPSPPKGWLEEAATLPDLARRPPLLRWIAQHRKAPTHLRVALLARLPWRILTQVADDASAHPQARAIALERLQSVQAGMTLGERRSFALHAPRPLWPQVWNVRDTRVIGAFLMNPKLGLDSLLGLLQPPLSSAHADALAASRWREWVPVAHQVLRAMDATFGTPEGNLVLGQAAPWIKALPVEERVIAAARMTYPPLRRATRAWAGHRPEGLDPSRPPEDPSFRS